MSYDDNNPQHRKELNDYLTRPSTPQEDKRQEEQYKKLEARKKTDMESWVKKTTANNENPGSFQRLVKQNEYMDKLKKQGIEESSVKQPGYPKRPDPMEVRGQQTIALTNTANDHLRKQIKNGNLKREDMILKEDKNGLMVNKNRTIAMRDSFMAKQFNKALGVKDMPTEASPEQFGALAQRLERDRQMRGAPTNVKKFADGFRDKPKPFIKKKVVHTPYKFPEFKIDPVLPLTYFKPDPPDPRLEAQKRSFDRMVEESKRPKGLPGILALNKKI